MHDQKPMQPVQDLPQQGPASTNNVLKIKKKSLKLVTGIAFIIIIGILALWFAHENSNSVTTTSLALSSLPRPVSPNDIEYISVASHVILQYPKSGNSIASNCLVMGGTCTAGIGVCGNHITDTTTAAKGGFIQIDNLEQLQVIPWSGSIISYLQSKNALSYYQLVPMKINGADSAYLLSIPRSVANNPSVLTNAPLKYVMSIYHRANSQDVYLFSYVSHPTRAGCVPDVNTYKLNLQTNILFF